MNKWWDASGFVGEMMGSFLLTFAVLGIIYVSKQKSLGLDSNFKKRIFLGLTVPAAVLMALVASKGFGAHGQLNPSITLMVAAYEGQWESVPGVIGFQLIGALMAAVFMVIALIWLQRSHTMKDAFGFSQQTVTKTVGMEFFGNMMWLLPIAGMLVAYVNYAHGVGVTTGVNFVWLATSAATGKLVLVLAFEELGAANFNPMIWFGRMAITFFAQKGKINSKELSSEVSGVITSLTLGVSYGYLATAIHELAV